MTQKQDYAHQPVMLEEVLQVLPLRADGFYIDATFGRGGHSRALLAQLGSDARLIGIDRDPQAIAAGQELERAEARFRIVAGRFDCVSSVVEQEGRPLDGILMDLGVSSPQLDDASRGFSFLRDGPLDMRMDPTSGQSAAQWLAVAAEQDIANVLYRYGEEKKSRRLARAICAIRQEKPITTTLQLAEIIAQNIGRAEKGKHPATRSFQAIRIFINQELDALELALQQAVSALSPGGRLAVISFHSLEDRIVKLLVRDASGRAPRARGGLPLTDEQPITLNPIGKAIYASDAEVSGNPRSRSAVLRVAEKVAVQ